MAEIILNYAKLYRTSNFKTFIKGLHYVPMMAKTFIRRQPKTGTIIT